jgi:hypothetical protein
VHGCTHSSHNPHDLPLPWVPMVHRHKQTLMLVCQSTLFVEKTLWLASVPNFGTYQALGAQSVVEVCSCMHFPQISCPHGMHHDIAWCMPNSPSGMAQTHHTSEGTCSSEVCASMEVKAGQHGPQMHDITHKSAMLHKSISMVPNFDRTYLSHISTFF